MFGFQLMNTAESVGILVVRLQKNGINAVVVLVVDFFDSVVLEYNEVDRKQY